jgi:hypothetical protein
MLAKWRLAWRGSKDGFTAKKFHSLCDLKGDNIVVIKSTTGHLFGGYCSTAWGKRESTCEIAPNSFIFTLTNPYGIPPTKYLPKKDSCIYHYSTRGPTFGSDIWVEDNCNKRKVNKHVFPNRFLDTTGKGEKTFTGSRTFTVSDIEVFIHS